MDLKPNDALIDELIKRRLDEILPQRIEQKLAELRDKKPGSMAMIATKGTLDWAYPPFILATTASALGWNVSVFFTFYGLNLLKKDISDLHMSPLGNPGTPMKQTVHNKGVASIPELRSLAIEGGVELIGCQMTVDLFGFKHEDFIPEVKEYVGAASFLAIARDADVTLFGGPPDGAGM